MAGCDPLQTASFLQLQGKMTPMWRLSQVMLRQKVNHCWSRSSPGTAHWELFQTGGCVLSLMLLHLHCARTWVLGFNLSRSHHQVQPDMPLTKCLSHHIPTPFCLCVGMSDGVPEPQGRALAGTQSTLNSDTKPSLDDSDKHMGTTSLFISGPCPSLGKTPGGMNFLDNHCAPAFW